MSPAKARAEAPASILAVLESFGREDECCVLDKEEFVVIVVVAVGIGAERRAACWRIVLSVEK